MGSHVRSYKRRRVVGIILVIFLCAGLMPLARVTGIEIYSKRFTWQYGGHAWSWNLSIPADRYDAYKGVPVPTRIQFGPSSWDFLVTTNDTYVRSMAGALHEAAVNEGYSTYEEVSFILAFVQCLPYTSDSETTGYNEYPRFPLETLVDDGGDCEDTSILFATLVLVLNYSAVFIGLPGHLAVGVWGSDSVPGDYYLHDGRRYYYCETTWDGYEIGQIPAAYQSASATLYDIDESRQFIPPEGGIEGWVILSIILIIAGTVSGLYFIARSRRRRKVKADGDALESAAPGAPPMYPRL